MDSKPVCNSEEEDLSDWDENANLTNCDDRQKDLEDDVKLPDFIQQSKIYKVF